MPDTYERRRRDRWLYELAGIPVDEPVAPTYEDLRLAQAGGVPASIPYDQWKPPEDRAADIAEDARLAGGRPPEGAPNATPPGQTPITPETDRVRFYDPETGRPGDFDVDSRAVAERLDSIRKPAHRQAYMDMAMSPPGAADPKLYAGMSGPALDGGSQYSTLAVPESLRPTEQQGAYAPPSRPESAQEDPFEFLANAEKKIPQPDVTFNPFEARERTRALYGENDPVVRRNDWEDEFVGRRRVRTDRDLERESALRGIFGNPGEALQWRQQRVRERQEHEQGAIAMHDRDRAESMRGRRISRADAEALASSGIVSPETAVRLTNEEAERVMKGWQNGAYQFGAGIKRSELDAYLNLLRLQTGASQAADKNQTQRDIAERKIEAEHAPLRPPPHSQLVQVIQGNGDVNGRVARMVAGNEPGVEKLPPDVRARAEKARDDYLNAPDEQTRRELYKNAGLGEPRNRDKTAGASNSPALVLKQEQAYEALNGPFQEAYEGARLLNKKLPLIAQFGTAGWAGLIQRGALSAEEQAAASAIHALVGQYRKNQFGTTLTPAERNELNSITGLASGDHTQFFQSPASIMAFLNRVGRALERQRRLLDTTLRQPAGAEGQ